MLKRVLIAAGGTGGHIFPGLAVAKLLQQAGVDVHWLGSSTGLEVTLVKEEYPMSCIAVKSLRGKGILGKLASSVRLVKAIFQALRVMQTLKPDVVVGMGGFVSGPAGVAAWLLRIPVVIHEQNSISGYTNRILSRIAKRVFSGFPGSFKHGVTSEVVGNPVRDVFYDIPKPEQRLGLREGPLRILVFGGSQGAHVINQNMLEAASLLAPSVIEIWHQTGVKDCEAVTKQYKRINVRATVVSFIDDMAEAYQWADLVICRSGALSVSEIAAVGVASILIPFPYAVDDHQYHNACWLGDVDAAHIVRESCLTAEVLSHMISEFIGDR